MDMQQDVICMATNIKQDGMDMEQEDNGHGNRQRTIGGWYGSGARRTLGCMENMQPYGCHPVHAMERREAIQHTDDWIPRHESKHIRGKKRHLASQSKQPAAVHAQLAANMLARKALTSCGC